MIPVLMLWRTRSAASLKKRPIHQNRDTDPSTYELMSELQYYNNYTVSMISSRIPFQMLEQ
jgi:hypothetical protein